MSAFLATQEVVRPCRARADKKEPHGRLLSGLCRYGLDSYFYYRRIGRKTECSESLFLGERILTDLTAEGRSRPR